MAKTENKIIEGLTQLVEGFSELEDKMEAEYGADAADDEISTAIVSEVVACLESVIESEDYTPQYLASVVSALHQSLEELDPDIFSREEESEEEDDDDSDDDDEEEIEDEDEEEE